MVGERIISSSKVKLDHCNSNPNYTLYQQYCANSGNETGDPAQELLCKYFKDHPPRLVDGIPGIASGVFISKS